MLVFFPTLHQLAPHATTDAVRIPRRTTAAQWQIGAGAAQPRHQANRPECLLFAPARPECLLCILILQLLRMLVATITGVQCVTRQVHTHHQAEVARARGSSSVRAAGAANKLTNTAHHQVQMHSYHQ